MFKKLFFLILFILKIKLISSQVCSEDWSNFIINDGEKTLLNVDKSNGIVNIEKASINELKGETIEQIQGQFLALQQQVAMLTQKLTELQAKQIPKIRILSNGQAHAQPMVICNSEETPINCQNKNQHKYTFGLANLIGQTCSCVNRSQAGTQAQYQVPVGDCQIVCLTNEA